MWRRILGLAPLRAQTLRHILNIYPPYVGAGVRVVSIAEDFGEARVEMPLNRWNRNYVGTHFGGSLYSMVDPFFMLLLLQRLGERYIVWDKAATIRFKKPGKGRVHAHFVVPEARVDAIRTQVAAQRKVEPVFVVEVRDEQGEVVAEVEKTLYVRAKRE